MIKKMTYFSAFSIGLILLSSTLYGCSMMPETHKASAPATTANASVGVLHQTGAKHGSSNVPPELLKAIEEEIQKTKKN